MRGGTSRGAFIAATDLPQSIAERDRVLLAVMGSPDRRQIDGLGGAHPLTSKVGIVSPGGQSGTDLNFLFAQLQPDSNTVDTKPNCGNMLAAVVPYAIETGMLSVQGATTTARVLTLNTHMHSDITVQTPHGQISYEGDTRIDGVPGTSAPVRIEFLNTAGSICSSLLPTGQVVDQFDHVEGVGSIQATCIDNGMPLVIVRAEDMGCSGYESSAELNNHVSLKKRLNALRLIAGAHMGLGDVSAKNYPKMTLVAKPTAGGSIATRSFIPHVCHDAIGVLAAVTVATACVLPESVANTVSCVQASNTAFIQVEHPSGEFTIELTKHPTDSTAIVGATLLRTARLIMRGEVMIPHSVWGGH